MPQLWRELIEVKVKDDPQVHPEFISLLEREDFDEAVYWAKKLNVPKDKLPFMVSKEVDALANGIKNVQVEEEENWDEEQPGGATNGFSNGNWETADGWSQNPEEEKCYKLPFSRENILLVESREDFANFICYLKSCSSVSRNHRRRFEK